MAILKARLTMLLLVCGLTGAWTVLSEMPAHADPTSLSMELRPVSPEGAGFGVYLLGTQDLNVTLTSPSPYQIGDNPKPRVRDSGSPFWVPMPNNHALPFSSYGFQVIGIRRDDDHGVGFTGVLTSSGYGSGQIPFDAGVADIKIAGHETTASDGSGLSLPSSMITGNFPLHVSGNVGYSTYITVTPHWGGGGGDVGSVQFLVPVGGGVAVYRSNGDRVDTTGIPVPSGGLSNEEVRFVTNDNFTGSGTIEAVFDWYNYDGHKYRAAASQVSARDYLCVRPLGNVSVCAVGFSESGYNVMRKNGQPPYTSSSMTFSDNGSENVGWSIPGYSGTWHCVLPPVPNAIAAYDPACFSSSTIPHVAALVYVNSQNPIPIVRLLGTSGDNGTSIMTAQNVGGSGNPPFAAFDSDLSSPFSTTVNHGTWTAHWYYDFNDRQTPNISAGATSHQLFATLASPQGPTITGRNATNGWGAVSGWPVTAKRIEWATSIGDGAGSITSAAEKCRDVLAQTPGWGTPPSYSDRSYLDNPWALKDTGKPTDCIRLALLASAGLNMLGVPANFWMTFPTADGTGHPPGNATVKPIGDPNPSCYSPTTRTFPYLGQTFNAKLIYRHNNFEGFFTVADPGIKAYTVYRPDGPFPNQDYYFLQVLRKAVTWEDGWQYWVWNGTQTSGGYTVHDGDYVPWVYMTDAAAPFVPPPIP